MIHQESMFPERFPAAEYTDAEGPDHPTPVLRPPGWTLIVGKSGPKGWHKVKARGTLGAVYTNCGLIGRILPEFEKRIVLCDDCANS